MEDFLNTEDKESSFQFDSTQVSWTTTEFLKLPVKSSSYYFIIFIFVALISSILYLSLTSVAITINSQSVISTQTPIMNVTTVTDFKVHAITARNGQTIQKGEAIVLGENRIKSSDYILFNKERLRLLKFVNNVISKECNIDCINRMREKAIQYFRYFRNRSLKQLASKIRENIFLLKTSSTQVLNNLKLQLADISELVKLTQKEQIINAPSSGIIIFADNLRKGTYLKRGETAFEIIPSHHNLIVKSYIHEKDISQIKLQMKSQIALDAYPPRKHGLLDGKISHVAVTKSKILDKEDYYEVEITFNQKDPSYEDKKLPILLGMTGKSFVVTGKTTLLKKYFGKIIGIN